MNNVYFSKEGMTSTEANFLANIAKEMQNAATERLENIKFFTTSVAVIDSMIEHVMAKGTTDLGFIPHDLQNVALLNAFCAWIREALKEKENQSKMVERLTMETWAIDNGIKLPESPEYPEEQDEVTEKDVIDSWEIDKRNKYLSLEAFAATYGKYIHPDGKYNKARKGAHEALNQPICKEGNGRDIVLYTKNLSVDINQVDSLFMSLQDTYRGYEKELNQLKAEIKDTVNKLNREKYEQYRITVDDWSEQNKAYNSAYSELRSQFFNWKRNELERISNLKIVIPNALKSIFNEIKAIDGTSK